MKKTAFILLAIVSYLGVATPTFAATSPDSLMHGVSQMVHSILEDSTNDSPVLVTPVSQNQTASSSPAEAVDRLASFAALKTKDTNVIRIDSSTTSVVVTYLVQMKRYGFFSSSARIIAQVDGDGVATIAQTKKGSLSATEVRKLKKSLQDKVHVTFVANKSGVMSEGDQVALAEIMVVTLGSSGK